LLGHSVGHMRTHDSLFVGLLSFVNNQKFNSIFFTKNKFIVNVLNHLNANHLILLI